MINDYRAAEEHHYDANCEKSGTLYESKEHVLATSLCKFDTPQGSPTNRNLPHPLHALDTWKASKCNRPTQKDFCFVQTNRTVQTNPDRCSHAWPPPRARASHLIGVSDRADGGNSCQYLLSIYSIMCKLAWTHSPCSTPICPFFLNPRKHVPHRTPPSVAFSFLVAPCCPTLIGQSPPLKTHTPTSLTSPTPLFPSFLRALTETGHHDQDAESLLHGKDG